MPNRHHLLALLLAFAPILIGCGERNTLAPVDGVLKLDGKPVPGVEVHFIPEVDIEAKTPPASRGLTDAQGTFSLSTDRGETGAVVGKHTVIIQYPPPTSRDERPPSGPRVPLLYQSFLETPIHVEVKPEANTVPINLKSRIDR